MKNPITGNDHPALVEIASRIQIEDVASAMVEDFHLDASSDGPLQITATLEIAWTGEAAEALLTAIQGRRKA